MLQRLYLENFALADRVEIEFKPGMNVLTGETGAGKSIIIGSLARVLGETAEKDDIRSGCKMAVVEADFDISGQKEIITELKANNIEPENDSITIRREIFVNKASRCLVNGQQLTLNRLRPITSMLAELHGQHSHQLLLDENNHLGFLDKFAGNGEKVEELRELYNGWDKTKKRLERLINTREQSQRERELLLFQKEEIEKAKIRAGEEEELLAEKKILDSSQVLQEKSAAIIAMLDEQEPSALEILGAAAREISDMTRLDNKLTSSEELLRQAVINIEELRSEIEAYRADIPDDPARLEEINLRLDELFRLKKKYGGSEEAIIETLNMINTKLKDRPDVDSEISVLRKETAGKLEEYFKNAVEVSEIRHKASKKLSAKVEKELSQLGMEEAEFSFEFHYEESPDGLKHQDRRIKPAPDGLESGRFLVSANPGEPLKPLAKTASGGEISRIMLAIKAAERSNTKSGFLVFDEVDAGIGGMTARAVSEKLATLAKQQQLLVVTHLHQIAEVGDYHYAVQKIEKPKEGRRTITIKLLSQKEKKAEINRMLAISE